METAEGQNGSEKLGSWKGPKVHNSFLAYKISGLVRLQKKTLRTGQVPKNLLRLKIALKNLKLNLALDPQKSYFSKLFFKAILGLLQS